MMPRIRKRTQLAFLLFAAMATSDANLIGGIPSSNLSDDRLSVLAVHPPIHAERVGDGPPRSSTWTLAVTLLSVVGVGVGTAAFLRTDDGSRFDSRTKRDSSVTRRLPCRTVLSAVVVAVVASFVFRATDTRLWAAVVAFVSYWSRRYAQVLATHPVSTKSVTTAFIQYISDFGAQWVELLILDGGNSCQADTVSVKDANEETVSAKPPIQTGASGHRFDFYDHRRGVACAIDGLVVSGPVLHVIYDWMERMIPINEGDGSTFAAVLHVLINDFFVDAFFVALLFVSTAVTEGCTHDLPRQLRQDLYPAVKASWASSVALFPVEFLCFRFLPLSFRVLSMNLIDIVWGAMISYMAHRSRKKVPNDASRNDG